MGKITGGILNSLILIIRVYKYLLSPLFGQSCRFYPSCSFYAVDALKSHGLWHGCYLTLHRLFRCHPWCKGGIDLVPERKKHVNQNA